MVSEREGMRAARAARGGHLESRRPFPTPVSPGSGSKGHGRCRISATRLPQERGQYSEVLDNMLPLPPWLCRVIAWSPEVCLHPGHGWNGEVSNPWFFFDVRL